MAFDKFHDKNTNVQPFFLKFATMRYQKPYVGSGSSIISMAPSRHPVIHSVRCMGNASGFSKALWNKAAVSTMIYYLVQCAWRNKSHFSLGVQPLLISPSYSWNTYWFYHTYSCFARGFCGLPKLNQFLLFFGLSSMISAILSLLMIFGHHC